MSQLKSNYMTQFGKEVALDYHKTSVASQLINALMSVLLTCGYSHVKAIANQLYDKMGVQALSPTMQTYEHVLLSLSLQGNMPEAEGVMRFLRHHHNRHLTIHSFNALMLGYRECKAFDSCDQL
uniref:Pentatricopeptide repeat-containing protein n=1 Tax=Lygus hesperus TaxID=30085 RepID=A0A0A9WYH2_LYGHE